MDFRKSKILLEKISALHQSMSSDAENVSSIDLDLMKSYVRQLYEALLDLPEADEKATQSNSSPKVEVIKASKAATPPPRPTPPPIPDPPKVEEPEVITPPPPPPPKVEPTPPPTPKQEPEVKTAPKITTRPPVSPELEELFSFETAKELSEKLSEMPISDIRKAMGLNERIFTVNELFGGEKDVFDTTVAELNKMNSFEEAKRYLITGVAAKYNWASKDRKNKAKTFIKLVKRRYN